MGTLEATLSMLESMPEEARRMVFEYTQKLFVSRKPASPFVPLTSDQILADLGESRQQSEQGMSQNMKDALCEMGQKHGFV